MRHRYFLAFDGRSGAGVREHFFHFMWGYLLPAVHAIIGIEANRADCGQNEFVFISCGPVMDVKTREMARLLGVAFTIVDDEQQGREPGTISVAVRRWDAFLRDYTAFGRLSRRTAALELVRQAVRQRAIPSVIRSRRMVMDIGRLRQVILEKVAAAAGVGSGGDDPDCYYLLKRSEEPSYYSPEHGLAQKPTYGTSRRSLRDIESAAVALSSASSRVGIFEPGKQTLAEQIRTFMSCRGIIAIRGAELANIVWLSAASRVIVINAGTFQAARSPAWAIAQLLGIDYAEIEWGENPHPALTNELIGRISDHIA